MAVYQDHLSVANTLLDQQDEINRLRGQIADVRRIHSEFKIYQECDHDHVEGEDGVVLIDEVGLVCADGVMYSICRECCAPGGSRGEYSQSEDCVDNHGHDECWPCPTRKAVDDSASERPTDTTEETPNG